MTGLISLTDIDHGSLMSLVDRSCQLYRDITCHDRPLHDLVVGILFTATSTRTRTAFSVGTVRLGGTPLALGSDDLQLATGESLADTARILGSMLDVLVVRNPAPIRDMRELAAHARIPVVNAMAREEHPTQAVCDIATMALRFGDPAGLRVLYVGEGNNSASALAHGLALIPGATVTFALPPGYGLPAGQLAAAQATAAVSGASITECHSLDDLPDEVDVVYTTRWQTTGTAKADPAWREVFRPFYVDDELMARWPKAGFMHDLPAHRGDEVSGSVLDGPRSIAWLQARMKLFSAMSVLEWSLAGATGR